MLMNVVFVRRTVMQYRGNDFKYDDESGEVEGNESQEPQAKKQYRRKSAIRAKRRGVKKSTNHPGCGMGARRNHRWTW
jgi:hypothetical protein